MLQDSTEIDLLRQRLVSDALEHRGYLPTIVTYVQPQFEKARDYLAQLPPNGQWADVDYRDEDNEWAPLKALDRILVMTDAYYQKTDPMYHDAALLAGISRALHYWYEVVPRCKNWYKNEIAKQFYLNVIALLLQDDITPELLAKMVGDLTETPRMTGSNKTLLSISVVYRGVIEKNKERIIAGIQGVKDQIEITTAEGIQPDYSFHQHGPFIYNGSYGNNFLRESSWLAAIVRGTNYAYLKEEMKILRDYFLDGTRWMLRGQLLDYNVRGRQVGRSSGFGFGSDNLISQLEHLRLADPEHAALYQTAEAQFRAAAPQKIEGHRHFWRSDYSVHQRPGYFTSLKMCSRRTVGMEMDVNSENLYGFYLPYGLTYIYRRGDEYLDIFPVWDWALLPGVTSPHQELRLKGRSTQNTSFVGGVSDGNYGVSAMDLDIQETRAKKSWFWFGQEWVALGAGIRSEQEAPVVTGINQTLLRGEVRVSGGDFSGPQQPLTGSSWVWHDSVAYIFPGTQPVFIKAEVQSGQLQKIFGLGADSTYRSEVFSLWIDHGEKPQDATYAYTVLPDCGSKDAARYSRRSPIRILANTAQLQAVYHKKLRVTGLAFYQAGSCSISKQLKVEVDRPCLLLLDLDTRTITLAEPTTTETTINVRITDAGKELFSRSLTLPTNAFAGSSVTAGW